MREFLIRYRGKGLQRGFDGIPDRRDRGDLIGIDKNGIFDADFMEFVLLAKLVGQAIGVRRLVDETGSLAKAEKTVQLEAFSIQQAAVPVRPVEAAMQMDISGGLKILQRQVESDVEIDNPDLHAIAPDQRCNH